MTWWTSEDDLRSAFGDLSIRILQIQFLEHKPNGKSKGMAIVEFVDVATAELAKHTVEGREMVGKRVWEISFARNAPMRAYERPPRNHYSPCFPYCSYFFMFLEARTEHNPRDNQVNNRPSPQSRPIRSDQQYHQRSDRIHHEISYEDGRYERGSGGGNEEYQQHHTRHVHREESGYDQHHYSRNPNRTGSRDARSKSPERRTSSSTHHHERRRY